MEDKMYLFRVKYKDKFQFLKLSADDLNWDSFLNKSLDVFGIKQHINFHVKLTDNYKTPIEKLFLKDVIENFHKSYGFFIELHTNLDYKNMPKIVTPYLIEDFLVDEQYDWILLEYKNKNDLSESARKQLVKALVEFSVAFFEVSTLQKTHKVMAITAALQLLPNLSKPGQEDHFTNAMCGYMDNRIKNVHRKEKKLARAEAAQKDIEDENGNVSQLTNDIVLDESELEAQNLIDKMKSMVIDNKDLETIQTDLRSSRAYRIKMLLNNRTDLLESFPYFFHVESSIKLISFEFADRFDKVDTTAFVMKWDKTGSCLAKLLSTQYPNSAFFSGWGDEIHTIFTLLKLLPSSKTGRNGLANNITFQNACAKLIIFRKPGVPPADLIEQNNNHPYIIAVGERKTNIMRYFIEVEKHLICIPTSLSFIDVFDIFFKVHKIFDLNFDNSLASAMFFVQHYIYQMTDTTKKPTARMEDIYNRMVCMINSEQENEQ